MQARRPSRQAIDGGPAPGGGRSAIGTPRPGPVRVLAGLAMIAVLYFARDVIVPVVAAIVVQFVVAPAMRTLCRWRIPAPISAALIIVALAGAMSTGIYYLASPVSQWVERLPRVTAQVQEILRVVREPVQQVQRASEQVERATTVTGPDGSAQIVTVRKPSLLEQIASGLWRFVFGVGVALIVLYFLLTTGEMFKLKLVRVIPRLADKKRALAMFTEIEHQVSRYLSTQTAINIGLGAALALIFWGLGLPNPALWGLMIAVLNFVPFFGFIVAASVVTTVAIVSVDPPWLALAAPAAYAVLKVLEGNFFAPSVLGYSLTLNPLVIILSLLFWGWLWGPVGALLAVPLLVIIKTVCDHFESLSTVGEFISGERPRSGETV